MHKSRGATGICEFCALLRAELECGIAAEENTQPTRSLYKQMSGANNVSGERLKVGASSVVSDAGKLA
jgi:hypothetical protein